MRSGKSEYRTVPARRPFHTVLCLKRGLARVCRAFYRHEERGTVRARHSSRVWRSSGNKSPESFSGIAHAGTRPASKEDVLPIARILIFRMAHGLQKLLIHQTSRLLGHNKSGHGQFSPGTQIKIEEWSFGDDRKPQTVQAWII